MLSKRTKFGKFVFVKIAYVVFWFVFYGVWILIPYEWFDALVGKVENIAPYYIFGFVPLVSFFIPPYIRRRILIKKGALYGIHIFAILLSIALFFVLATWRVYQNTPLDLPTI